MQTDLMAAVEETGLIIKVLAADIRVGDLCYISDELSAVPG